MRRLSVRIADAHRRLVRTIRLHYHSKPVGSLTDLRMPENAAKWRLAATVHVSRLCVFCSRAVFRWMGVGVCVVFLSQGLWKNSTASMLLCFFIQLACRSGKGTRQFISTTARLLLPRQSHLLPHVCHSAGFLCTLVHCGEGGRREGS